MVEDNPADALLIRRATQAAGIDAELYVLQDGEQAIEFIERLDHDENLLCPALVILDINLPKRPGGEVLQSMRKSRRCRNALVIAVSTSDSQQDRMAMAALGANTYFHKPSDYAQFMMLGDMMKDILGDNLHA